MKTRITKQVKQELKQLLDKKGYWNEEVRNYISQFEYYVASKLHLMSQAYEKYNMGELAEI